jgi:hypothetical protein
MSGVWRYKWLKAEVSMEKRKYEVAYHILAALLLLMISSSAVAQEYVPIEDLQWLYIEGMVGLIAPRNAVDAAKAPAIMDRAYEARTAGESWIFLHERNRSSPILRAGPNASPYLILRKMTIMKEMADTAAIKYQPAAKPPVTSRRRPSICGPK